MTLMAFISGKLKLKFKWHKQSFVGECSIPFMLLNYYYNVCTFISFFIYVLIYCDFHDITGTLR